MSRALSTEVLWTVRKIREPRQGTLPRFWPGPRCDNGSVSSHEAKTGTLGIRTVSVSIARLSPPSGSDRCLKGILYPLIVLALKRSNVISKPTLRFIKGAAIS